MIRRKAKEHRVRNLENATVVEKLAIEKGNAGRNVIIQKQTNQKRNKKAEEALLSEG